MPLKANDLADRYQDLVHVNKSGAGLADHDGGPAGIFLDDGAGGVDQIIGRTAVRHWLDPHPDAAGFDETFEFSTLGDMNQTQLESAGWTFSNCTGVVEDGILWVERSASAYWRASINVNFTGDFDVVAGVTWERDYSSLVGDAYNIGGIGVGDTTNDVSHFVGGSMLNGYGRRNSYINGTWTNLTGTNGTSNSYNAPDLVRINRVSGTVRLWVAGPQALIGSDDTLADRYGWGSPHSVADADTFDRLYIQKNNGTGTGKVGIYFIRRFQ